MSRTGRPPIPDYLKVIKGTASRADRLRNKAKAPCIAGKPQPPDFLTVEARQEWEARCDVLYRAGMITQLDGTALALYCQAYGRWRQAEKLLAALETADDKSLLTRAGNGRLLPHPLIAIAAKAMSDTMRFAAELRLTPISRKTHIEPPRDDDPGDKYLV